ncbi:glycosyltransferase family 61 protein [Brevibacillus sp. GCM10020057]|uniref:glycosyltransferase family 61 protein n=1 Tax=Brevibacillus sp. GCM10020057 TaxID=3317327 RepID=UPI003640160F
MYRGAVPHYIAKMDRGRIWGPNGAVISPDNKLVWDMSQEPCVPRQHPIFRQTELPMPEYMPLTLGNATYNSAANYFFWMVEVLARIELWRSKGIEIDKYVINKRVRSFQWETLQTLGIPEERLIECHKDLHIQARQLVLTPVVAYTGQVSKWICDLLRIKLGPPPGTKRDPFYEKIYVSRAGATHRHVHNEQELNAYLAEKGFVTIHCDRYTVAEQAYIFSSAKTVIAPHGAALTNLVFCQPGTKVIELFSPNWVRHTYWVISTHCRLEYYRLIGKQAELENPTEFQRIIDDIRIDWDNLHDVIQQAGVL